MKFGHIGFAVQFVARFAIHHLPSAVRLVRLLSNRFICLKKVAKSKTIVRMMKCHTKLDVGNKGSQRI